MSISLETLENTWKANPGGLAFAQYADALQRGGRAGEAKAVLVEGLTRWPKHFAGRVLLGKLAQDQGDLETARAAFQEAVSLDSNSPSALKSLAIVLGKQQYQRQAIDHWVRLSLLDPGNAEAAATARKMISDLETTSSLADLGIGIRDVEDVASREALSEGTSSLASPKGLSGLDSDSPLGNWGSEAGGQAADAAFDLGDLAFPAPPSMASSPASWSPSAGMDSTLAQAQIVPSPESEPVSKPRLGPSDDSAFATIEMASFPAKTIPPPPLELAKQIASPGNESGTHLLETIPAPPRSLAPVNEGDATQFMPRTQSAQVTGDDIGARLDALFQEPATAENLAVVPALPAILPPPPPAPIPMAKPVPAAPSSPQTPTRVTGDDVEDRLSELFGGPSETAEIMTPAAPPAASNSSAKPKGAVTGEDIEARLDDLFGASSVDVHIPEPAAAPAAPKSLSASTPPISSSNAVNGRDIEDRLDSLFGSETDVHKDTLNASDTSAMERGDLLGENLSDNAEATLENMRAFETAAAPVPPNHTPADLAVRDRLHNPSSTDGVVERLLGSSDPSDVDSGGSTIDLPTTGPLPSNVPHPAGSPRLSGQDLDSQLDELFASSEFMLDEAPPPAATRKIAPTTGGPITGDDIGDRLDDLFGPDSDFPAGVPTVTLAEEYLRQGYRDQALAVFRQLASRDPANADIARRIAAIEKPGS